MPKCRNKDWPRVSAVTACQCRDRRFHSGWGRQFNIFIDRPVPFKIQTKKWFELLSGLDRKHLLVPRPYLFE